MRNRERIFACGLVYLLLHASANGQSVLEGTFPADVAVAVAQALGADPAMLPSYQGELESARLEADTLTICGAVGQSQFLNAAVAEKVVAKALETLKGNPVISERPQYVTDLVVVSAVSFEAGRLAASSDQYRESLC